MKKVFLQWVSVCFGLGTQNSSFFYYFTEGQKGNLLGGDHGFGNQLCPNILFPDKLFNVEGMQLRIW